MRLDVNDTLYGDFVGLEFLDDVDEVGADRRERGRLGDVFRNRDHIEGEHSRLAGVAFEDGVAGVTDGGVDGEDSHGLERDDETFFYGEGFLIRVEGEEMGGTDEFCDGEVENTKPTMLAGEGVGGGKATGFCGNFCGIDRT